MRMSFAVVACMAVLLVASFNVQATEEQACAGNGLALRYEAYIAGVNAGQANLQVSRSGTTYQVAGTARSLGLWESIQRWRAQYSVTGELVREAPASAQSAALSTQLLPKPGHFFSLQTTPKKRREIHIEEGVLKETKNRKVRDPRPAQTGYDLLSALFFLPSCHSQARIHTGRDGYEFTRTGEAGEGCSYKVLDEEGAAYRLELTYQQIAGLNVPNVIGVRGPLPGRMVLTESTPVDVQCGAGERAN